MLKHKIVLLPRFKCNKSVVFIHIDTEIAILFLLLVINRMNQNRDPQGFHIFWPRSLLLHEIQQLLLGFQIGQ